MTGIAIIGILTIETVVGILVAAIAGAIVLARALYNVYRAERDRRICIRRARRSL